MAKQTVQLRFLRIAPRKVRLVASLLSGMPVQEAEAQLLMSRLRPSKPLLKLLRSGISAATLNKLDGSRLVIESFRVDGGPMLKRMLPRARGSASPIQKKMSHVTLVLAESSTAAGNRFKIMAVKKVKRDEDAKPKLRAKDKAKENPETEKENEKRDQRQNPGFFRRTFRRKSIG